MYRASHDVSRPRLLNIFDLGRQGPLSLYYRTDVVRSLLPPACPRKCRVGANSPSL